MCEILSKEIMRICGEMKSNGMLFNIPPRQEQDKPHISHTLKEITRLFFFEFDAFACM